MHRPKYLLLVVLACLLVPATAAVAGPPRSIAEDLAVADRYWAAQGYPDPCAGQVTVVVDPTLTQIHADGGVNADLYGGCAIAVLPGLDQVALCQTIVHEIGHLSYGHLENDATAHSGPMAPENLRPTECLPRPPTPRQALIRSITASLPKPAGPWKVACTPTSRRMRCWARSPRARFVRRITAKIARDGSFEWGY